MRSLLQWLAVAICTVAGVFLTFDIVAGDIPVYFGFVYGADAVSLSELLVKSLLAVMCLGVPAWLWWRLPKENEPPG